MPLDASPEDRPVVDRRTLADIKREAILDALRRHNGVRIAAAQDLGMPVRTMADRIREYIEEGYDVPRAWNAPAQPRRATLPRQLPVPEMRFEDDPRAVVADRPGRLPLIEVNRPSSLVGF